MVRVTGLIISLYPASNLGPGTLYSPADHLSCPLFCSPPPCLSSLVVTSPALCPVLLSPLVIPTAALEDPKQTDVRYGDISVEESCIESFVHSTTQKIQVNHFTQTNSVFRQTT